MWGSVHLWTDIVALHFLDLSMGQCYYSEWLNCATVKVTLSCGMPRRHLIEWGYSSSHSWSRHWAVWSNSPSGRITPVDGLSTSTEQLAGWVPTAGEDTYEEINVLALPRTEPRFLGRPAHSLVTAPTARILDQVVITTATPSRYCKLYKSHYWLLNFLTFDSVISNLLRAQNQILYFKMLTSSFNFLPCRPHITGPLPCSYIPCQILLNCEEFPPPPSPSHTHTHKHTHAPTQSPYCLETLFHSSQRSRP